MSESPTDLLIRSRRALLEATPQAPRSDEAAEGGCGVLGLIANVPIAGRHVLTASEQMHNRGNGKGGGIAMVGLDAAQAKVSEDILNNHYLLQVAFLDPAARNEVEEAFILPHFDIAQAYELPHQDDPRQVPGLEIRPPDVWRYFVRVKPDVLAHFAAEHQLEGLAPQAVEDEFVYQNSYRLNLRFYASLGEKRAFVLSHGRNLSVLKIVGYAEQVVRYYCLEEHTAHVWIAHQRYPTKGRVWHPGGAHPFIGLNEALVHNGDFANYHAVSEYLRQRGIGQLFLTDTEVSVQLFDLWDRIYGYPLEITLEAMAPTTEYDFLMLPRAKQTLYRVIQRSHLHASPDGPWFFIIARSKEGRFELIGITDTSMLRPQVFALYENVQDGGTVQIGLIASERQAINACLRSLAAEDRRFRPFADKYWVARGGSHTDGGAFRFSLSREGKEKPVLHCTNKFGETVTVASSLEHAPARLSPRVDGEWKEILHHAFDNGGAPSAWEVTAPLLARWDWETLAGNFEWLREFGQRGVEEWFFAWQMFSLLHDRRAPLGGKKRASYLTLLDASLSALFQHGAQNPSGELHPLNWDNRHSLYPPQTSKATLLFNTLGFPPEGEESAARWIVRAYELGWRHFIAYHWHGGRFAACGLGSNTQGTRIDLYGDVGDYAASGLDGAEVHLHSDAQDQVGQILKSGKLVIYGDVGQTFLYGAKGGEVYVLGSAAGRPLINAVGRPRVVINGTCLDYLAESFMAGDPHHGGGFAILNGITFSEEGRLEEMPTPYPGGNLFSLASGGAIFLRDPRRRVGEEQLNGGAFQDLSDQDWQLIRPYLEENQRLFGITIKQLLTVDDQERSPSEVYRKVIVQEQSHLLREAENR